MASNIQQLYDLPDISFIDGIEADQIKREMIADYEKEYEAITGEKTVLRPGDRDHVLINVLSGKFQQGYEKIDHGCKMNLLKYSKGDFLKHLGAFKKAFKDDAKPAIVKQRFYISEPHTNVIFIPAGTRVTAGDGVYFSTDEYIEIKQGEIFTEVSATCLEKGEKGTGYLPGQINVLVDQLPYISKVENVTESIGGSEEESDNKFREKIFLAPSSYSTAGPDDAYVYWVRKYNNEAIEDVKVDDPEEGVVDVRIVLKNGEIPTELFCEGVLQYLKTNPVIPMTDHVIIRGPDVVNYDLKGVYYIDKSKVNMIDTIQRQIQEAKDAYIYWQRTKIGRDINPDTLVEFIRAAGGKRVELESPSFQVIPDTAIAREGTIELIYGGIEND